MKLCQILSTFALLLSITTPLSAAVIFQYHHVAEDTPPSTSVTVAEFESHLEFLEREGFQIWPLKKIVSYVLAHKDFPDRVAAITFDDAYVSVLENAAPRLKKRGWPFTLFVATEPVGQGHSHYLSWDQIRKVIAMGGEIGNHSVSHRHLVRINEFKNQRQWAAWVKQEILNAQETIQQQTGQTNRLFAYPYGEYSNKLSSIVDELDFAGFGQQSGAISSSSKLSVLPRFPMNRTYAPMEGFTTKALSLGFTNASLTPDYIVLDPIHLAKKGFDETQIEFQFHFDGSDVLLDQLACYASHAGKLKLTSMVSAKREKNDFVTFYLPKKLPPMRSRVNCTAPSLSKQGRFYWFSHPWIKPLENGEWYGE